MPNENVEFENHEDELPDHFDGFEIDKDGNLVKKAEK